MGLSDVCFINIYWLLQEFLELMCWFVVMEEPRGRLLSIVRERSKETRCLGERGYFMHGLLLDCLYISICLKVSFSLQLYVFICESAVRCFLFVWNIMCFLCSRGTFSVVIITEMLWFVLFCNHVVSGNIILKLL